MVSTAALIAAAFAALYAGHMVGDHIAQTDWQSQHKAGHWTPDRDTGDEPPHCNGARAMAGHLAGYLTTQLAAILAAAAAGVPFSTAGVVAGLAFSVATHGLIDRRWPVRWVLTRTGSRPFADLAAGGMNGMYLGDQTLHIGCLYVSALLVGVLS